MLRTIRDGLRALFRRDAAERELADEVQHYLDLATEQHVRSGAVAERAPEIGVRIALGATPRGVMSLILLQGMRMPAAGIALGLIAAAWLTRLMAHLLFDVTATDPTTFAMVTVVLAMVAATACYLAARRATRVDPLRTIRHA